MCALFEKFLKEFENSFSRENQQIRYTLENIFSMREIGNKTHGDLAEVALTEYIDKYVNDFSARHTGKANFRSKKSEEDIVITDIQSCKEIPISIKTYGAGPLQLSTNKDLSMFSYLKEHVGESTVTDLSKVKEVLTSSCFTNFENINVIPLIYDEKNMSFKIVIFELQKAYKSVKKIKFIASRPHGKSKTFPIYKFYDLEGRYIFEVRYGGQSANALQRGMWTNTEKAETYFKKLLDGNYQVNRPLVELIPKILNLHKNEHTRLLKSLHQS